MADCPRCGRVEAADMMDDPDVRCMGGRRCATVRAAFLRGLDEGVRLAKAGAVAFCTECRWRDNEEIDWTDVDAAVARLKEGK